MLVLCRMQVEVSKYTEGVNEKALRPNGLPKSLIRYDGKLVCSIGLVASVLLHFLFVMFVLQLDKRRRH